MFIVKFPVRPIVVLYVATSLVNKDEYIIYYAYILQYKVSFTYDYDRLGRCFRFVYIYACTPCSEKVVGYISPAVFKLGSADQKGSATGSHGVRERIPKSSNCLHGF